MYHKGMEKIEIAIEALGGLELTGWGIAPVSQAVHGEATQFRAAATMYVAYALPAGDDSLAGGAYSESALHEAIIGARDVGDPEVEKLCARLDESDISHWSVPAGQDATTLIGGFPQKRSAVEAGLGWIGKCSLFISPGHGPRVRLYTVLMDVEPPVPTAAACGSCGDCTACIDACPYGYLTGETWSPGSRREDLIDAFSCSRMMEKLGETIGRKSSCGRCLLACPLGSSRRT
jgi:epoxyqueuosine reductase